MTTEQAAQIPEALARAQAFAEASGLRTNLTDYMSVRESGGSSIYNLTLHTTDSSDAEVDVIAKLYPDGRVGAAFCIWDRVPA
jgi:hypothetical protein